MIYCAFTILDLFHRTNCYETLELNSNQHCRLSETFTTCIKHWKWYKPTWPEPNIFNNCISCFFCINGKTKWFYLTNSIFCIIHMHIYNTTGAVIPRKKINNVSLIIIICLCFGWKTSSTLLFTKDMHYPPIIYSNIIIKRLNKYLLA